MRLSIFRDEDGLRYEVERLGFRRAWHPFDEKRVQGLCAQLLPLAQSMTRPGKTNPEAFRQLETLSRALSRLLLPDAILEELRADSSHLALSIPPELDFIPWEWLHDGEDFWMRRHFTGRMSSPAPALPAPPPGRPLRMLVVVADPDRDLPHALREARTLVRELDRTHVFAARLMVNPRVNDLIRLFNLHAVVHYIGHMVVTDSPSGPIPAWKLADGTFGPGEIAAATFGGARVRLVFSNACPGKAMDPAVSARFPRALQEAGIPAVVASIMDVPDPTASAMSAGFYSDLAAGRRIADVLSMARERARSRLPSGDITWMVHVLYGNPETIPLPAAAGEVSARVRLPGAVPYKPPRPGNWRRNLGRKLEIGLLLVLALATGYQLGRPLFAGKERFSPVVFPLRADDFSGRVLFSGFSGASISPDEILEAEQCFLRALTTLPEIRIEDARGAGMPIPARNGAALEIAGRVVSTSSGGNRLLLWVRRVSDRVVLYADDFPFPLPDETPCVRLQDWVRQHRER